MGAGAGAKGAARYPKDAPPEELASVATELPFEQQSDLTMCAMAVELACPPKPSEDDWKKVAENATPQQKDKIWVAMEVRYGQRFGRRPEGLPEGYIGALRLEYVDRDQGALGCFLEDNPIDEGLVPLLDQVEAQVRDSSYPDEVLKSLERAWGRPATIRDWEWLEARAGAWNEAADAIIQKLVEAGVKRGQVACIDAHNNDPDGEAIFSAHFSKSLPDGGDLKITYDVQNTAEYGWEQFYTTAVDQAKAVPTADVISITSSCNAGGAAVTYVFKYDPAAADSPSRPLTWKESRTSGSDWNAAAKDIVEQIRASGAKRGQVLGIDAHNFGGQRAENEEELQKKRDEIAAIEADIGKLNEQIGEMKDDIKDATTSLDAAKQNEVNETAKREEGKEVYEANRLSIEEAGAALEKYLAPLSSYCAVLEKKIASPKVPASVQEACVSKWTGRMQKLMESVSAVKVVQTETNDEKDKWCSDEVDIQKAYEARIAELQGQQTSLGETVAKLQGDIAAAEGSIAEKTEKLTALKASAAENEAYLSKRGAGDAIFSAVLDLEKPSDGPLELGFNVQNADYEWTQFYDEASRFANHANKDDGEFRVLCFTASCSSGGKAVTYVFYEKKAGVVRFMPKPECIDLEGYITALRKEYVDRVEFALGSYMDEQNIPPEVRQLLEPHIEAQIRSSPNPGVVIAALKRAWTWS